MEVAGVVLSAVPLILFALENYQRAWDPMKDHWKWKETIGTIRNEIFLQKQQLDTTLGNLDLRDPTMDEVEAALQIRFPHQCNEFIDIITQIDQLLSKVAKDLYPDAQGPPKFGDSSTERANWEWRRVRRSFGKKERKEMFRKLQTWNAALQNCGLEKREILPDSENRIVNLIRKRFDEKKTKAIRDNAQGLHEAIKSGLGCTCSSDHKGSIQLDWHDTKPLVSTTFSLAFSVKSTTHSQLPGPDTSWKMISMNMEEIDPMNNATTTESAVTTAPALLSESSSSSTPTVTSLQQPQPKRKGVRYLTTLLSRDSSTRPLSSSGKLSPAPSSQTTIASSPVLSRSSSPNVSVKLCQMLRTLASDQPLLGFIPVPDSSPNKQLRILAKSLNGSPSLNDTTRPVHLQSLLSRAYDAPTNRRLALSRKQRFGIAAALTWAVLHLCDSPWLGKSVNNDEIHVFFDNRPKMTSSGLSNHPYLSYDFCLNPQNPTSPLETTTQTAQFQNKQIRNMTLFTLAIRLIELGLNRPFSQLRHEFSQAGATDATNPTIQPSPNSTIVDDFEIAECQILELYLDPGKAYADAADRCLRFLFPGPAAMNTFEYSSFRSTFFADVVAPVQATFELIPGSCDQIAF
ncbi:hypothetical protein BDV95DRAFT_559300 [Massariosphaeria phaeospora]|uniref:DUF7580 domain-containing protein n=1 Tax=Massariosphaeria phaeospora TaxID=100035 RepID=A0A7C8MXK2_9PLEO|nr:hypothetical protein BDV95DRAFT_559300 [Massariosphaeria phaeospora]